MHGLALPYAAGYRLPVTSSAFVLTAPALAVIGNSMRKIRRNSLCGIRTPWTLASDIVWERTHRIGGRLMVAHAFAVLIGGLIVLCAWGMSYSWRLAHCLATSSPDATRPR
jgi:uncharacterized membrane protein